MHIAYSYINIIITICVHAKKMDKRWDAQNACTARHDVQAHDSSHLSLSLSRLGHLWTPTLVSRFHRFFILILLHLYFLIFFILPFHFDYNSQLKADNFIIIFDLKLHNNSIISIYLIFIKNNWEQVSGSLPASPLIYLILI